MNLISAHANTDDGVAVFVYRLGNGKLRAIMRDTDAEETITAVTFAEQCTLDKAQAWARKHAGLEPDEYTTLSVPVF
jgi:hypothetical protein